MSIKHKKFLIAFSAFFVCVFLVGIFASKSTNMASVTPLNIVVAIDAGHGAPDGGTVGTSTGVLESDLNLMYADTLAKYLTDFGLTVVKTRTDKNALCSADSDTYKLDDMKKRVDIINASQAQILISIHMNKFTNSSENGAQVFFKQEDADSERLANGIRDILVANFDNARKLTIAGDYYILNNSAPVGVIVECGFLSNATEEKLLQTQEHRNKICYSIFCGIINYLNLIRY